MYNRVYTVEPISISVLTDFNTDTWPRETQQMATYGAYDRKNAHYSQVTARNLSGVAPHKAL
jgi:hypothetical protein